MSTLKRLERLLLRGSITETEYLKKADELVKVLLDLYVKNHITKEKLLEELK